MKQIIEIHSLVDQNSIEYYEYMINSHNNLASGKYELRYIAYFLRITKDDLRVKNNHMIYESYDLDYKTVKSTGHGDGITFAVRNASKRMKKDLCQFSIFADTDTAICLKNWDVFIAENIDKFGIIGTKYEDIGMPCSGGGKVQVYKNTPNCTWFALSNKHDYESIELFAKNSPVHNKLIDTQEMSDLYKLPIGYTVNFDTGWQWAKFCKEKDINYYVFQNGNPLVDKTPEGNSLNVLKPPYFDTFNLPRNVAQYPEEHMLHNGKTFLVHQRGSLKHRFRNNEHSTHFYNAYEKFLGI